MVTNTDWFERTAVVTGVAGAMGLEIARGLLDLGVNLIGFDRSQALDELPQDLSKAEGGRFVGIEVDVAQPESVVAAFERADATFGSIDYLVNVAGVTSRTAASADLEEPEWSRVLGVNLGGTFWCCREGLKRMMPAGRGAIVNIASIHGYMARRYSQRHAYAASKAGVIGLTKSLAAEAAGAGVRVNCIAPGTHTSNIQEKMAGSAVEAEEFRARVAAATPLGRNGSPDEMVGPVVFLLSSQSGFMTGQLIISDGGRSMWYE